MHKTIEVRGLGEAGASYRASLQPDGDPITIGAGASCAWKLWGSSAEPVHAELSAQGDAVWLCAHAPVVLEGRTITGWARLYASAALRIGSYHLRVEFVGWPSAVGRSVVSAFAAEKPTRVVHLTPREDAAPPTVREDPVRPTAQGPAMIIEGVAEGFSAPEPLTQIPLAQRFALPPNEGNAEKTAPKRNEPLLSRRFARVPTRWWLTISACCIGLLVGLTKPTVMSAHAERTDTAAKAPVPATAKAATLPLTDLPPEQGSAAPAAPSEDLREPMHVAAEALLRNDYISAWKSYDALAKRDQQYAAFALVLAQRVRALCENGRANPADCEHLR